MHRRNGAVLLGLLFILAFLVPPTRLLAQQDATVAPVPILAGKILLTDDFSAAGSGWFVTENQFGQCGYLDGEYVVALAPTSTGVIFCSRREIARDFIAEIDARVPSGGEEEGASILVRAKQLGPGQFFGYMRLSVRPAHGHVRLGINTMENGRWNPRTLAEVEDHPAVNRGSATNRLGIKVLGSTFVGYVNGQEILRVDDGTLPDGGIGLEVLGPRGNTTEAWFDNFVASELGVD